MNITTGLNEISLRVNVLNESNFIKNINPVQAQILCYGVIIILIIAIIYLLYLIFRKKGEKNNGKKNGKNNERLQRKNGRR